MFCYTDRVVTKSGDALPGYFVRVLNRSDGSIVPIYADENSTPIVTVSGVANAAKTDDLGNFSLFVEDGVYSVERLNTDSVRVSLTPYVNLGGKGPKGDTGDVTPALTALVGTATTAATTATTQAGIATTKAAEADVSRVQAQSIVASVVGPTFIPSITYGWRDVTTDATGRVVRGIRIDGTYFDALTLAITGSTAPASTYTSDLPGAITDTSGRVIIMPDMNGRLKGSYSGDFTPDRPARMPYIASGTLYLAGTAAALAGGAANWSGGATLTFANATVEGARIRTAAARGAAVEAWYYDAAGNAGFFDPTAVVLFVSNGQSLSCGVNGRNFVTFPPRSSRIRMPRLANNGSIRCGQYVEIGNANFAPVDPAAIVGDTMAYPTAGPIDLLTFGETTLERMAKVISDSWFAVTGRRQEMMIASLGVGTATIDNLAKGAAAPSPWVPNGANVYAGVQWDANIYNNQMARIARFVELWAAQGRRVIVMAVDFAQGESGSNDAAWDTKLATLIANWNADVKAITGQTWEPQWLLTQPSAIGSGTPPLENTQLAAVRAHAAGSAHLVKAQYPELGRAAWSPDPTGYTVDYVHKLGVGYAINGEYSARAFLSIASQQRRPSVVRPLSVAAVSGTQFDVTFEVPVGPLVLDASPGFTVPANFGVTYADSGGGATVTAVAVQSATVLRITVGSDISARSGRKFRFGINGPVSGSGFTATNMPRTAIRDSAATLSEVDGQVNRNWCVHSDASF